MDFGSSALSDAEWIGAVPHEALDRRARPQLPEDDPFYVAPEGFQHATPGTVLRSRDVELAFLGLIPQQIRAVQLLYRTTDMNGRPEAAATTIVVPAERGPEQICPVVSYQCAIDAITSRCFPSYALRRHAVAPGSVPQFEMLLVAAAIAEGWAVSVPDHEGVNGSWGTPYEPGYRILDGLRAAIGSEQLDLSPEAPIGLWGYSGGGLASAWAAEMSGTYAPELNIVGAVLGSPVGDLGRTFRKLNGTFAAALPALVVAALADVYPGLQRIIAEHTSEYGRDLLDRLHHMTTVEAIVRFWRTDMGDLLDQPLEQILSAPEVQHVFDDIKLGAAVPTPPVLIIQAVHDEIISVDGIDELADTYSSGGAHVTYHRDMFSEHLLLHPMSAPMALRWLSDRFAGRPLGANLARTTWPTLFNPSTYRGMARLAVITAKVLTGRRLRRLPLSVLDR
ncbi:MULTISPECIES: lipase family protein [Mycobacteriaceae]|uniref:Lipase n=1 Tax=Mycolicibacterium neoaurum VKM Ac-1815D TaxID=700508 RepID=V5XAX2_MYCNE|nr:MULTISPECIES: lipase family protein [Mycobacteriaceae]AHC25580.1 lipase [Mycolicibacterium neoaurum VKM Ac-1815D]AMO06034.1 lipase [Mycolicibacterium neoaurum]AXK75628.1 lipase [Mycolicibacterium neoaurum]KJQ50455.1 lipase [Mycolicibacterium neoaurum]KUM09636.1 lipase [Mycolicibacterium neoaurum]